MIFEIGNRYTFEDFARFEDEVTFVQPTYGNNEVRVSEKIIELNGFLIEDVDLIKINTSGGFVVMDLVNSVGRRMCRKIMKWTETLEVSSMCGVPVYKFVS